MGVAESSPEMILKAIEALSARVDEFRADVCGHLHQLDDKQQATDDKQRATDDAVKAETGKRERMREQMDGRVVKLEESVEALTTSVGTLAEETKKQTGMLNKIITAGEGVLSNPAVRVAATTVLILLTTAATLATTALRGASAPSSGGTLSGYERDLASCGPNQACTDSVRERYGRAPPPAPAR